MARKTYSVTVDESIAQEFKDMCKGENVNQSMLIEAFMRAYVNKHIRLELVNNKPEVQVR